MDPVTLESLLKVIRNAMARGHRNNDVSVPPFYPDRSENSAEGWCTSVDSIVSDLVWNSVTTVTKAGKALMGSALASNKTWDPDEGRSWVPLYFFLSNALTNLLILYIKCCKFIL